MCQLGPLLWLTIAKGRTGCKPDCIFQGPSRDLPGNDDGWHRSWLAALLELAQLQPHAAAVGLPPHSPSQQLQTGATPISACVSLEGNMPLPHSPSQQLQSDAVLNQGLWCIGEEHF